MRHLIYSFPIKLALSLTLLFGLYFIQYNLSHPYKTIPLRLSQNDYIDEYLYGAKMRRFNKDGQLIQDFQLKEWAHYHIAGIAYFILPHLILHSPEATWSIKSNKGQTTQAHLGEKLKIIDLSDEVNIEHIHNKQAPLSLSTEHLHFLLNENRSYTHAPVKLKQSSLIIEAIGADADFRKGTIHLNENVKTIYTPEHV